MRKLVGVVAAVIVASVVSCMPSPAQLRMKRVSEARTEAQRPGPRQARNLAEAIHDAYTEGDYKKQPQLLQQDVAFAIQVIDAAVPNAGLDAPTLVGWRALMLTDIGQYKESFAEFQRSFQMAPNEMAGRNLIIIYGAANSQQDVSTTCQATFNALTTNDDRMSLVSLCRKHMNAISEGAALGWMTREQLDWYYQESARREEESRRRQQIAYEQQQHENRIVRRAEQCFAGCKERGLRCQNRCGGDEECDHRCVEINHACVDRCEAAAKEELGE
jgi:hypothetical protein